MKIKRTGKDTYRKVSFFEDNQDMILFVIVWAVVLAAAFLI